MPDRDFDPKKGGWFKHMNEFCDAMCWYGLRSAEWQIVNRVMRKTWGVKGRAWAPIGYVDFMEICNLSNSSVSRTLRSLIKRNFIHRKTVKGKYHYKINSKPSTWKTAEPHEYKRKNAPELQQNDTPELEHKILQDGSKNTPELKPPTFNRKDIKDNCKDTPLAPITENGDSGSPVMTKKEILEQDARTVVDFINEIAGKGFKHSETSLAPIRGRLRDGYTLQQCLEVCHRKWFDPDHNEKYYRPITLFRPSLFESYINEQGKKHKPTKREAKMQATMEMFARRHHERENPTEGN